MGGGPPHIPLFFFQPRFFSLTSQNPPNEYLLPDWTSVCQPNALIYPPTLGSLHLAGRPVTLP
ncbi:hypothetical protein TNIN_309001, partial [Trichonephila inaurata madagascariensis]